MSESEKTGLFHACYRIETPGIGGPVLNLNLTVDTSEETVNGIGEVIQGSINPPLKIKTKLLGGTFTYMTIMPDITHILVTATGYPIIYWPPHLGIGPVILPNVELRMVLDQDWKSGTANYKYRNYQGFTTNQEHWHSVNNALVQLSNCPVLA